MTFARTIVEQNIDPYNVLQLSDKHSRTFLEQFQIRVRTKFYKIEELFQNSSRPVCWDAQVLKKHKFAYICKSEVCSHDILYSWSIITEVVQKYFYLPQFTPGGYTHVSKCVHMTP